VLLALAYVGAAALPCPPQSVPAAQAETAPHGAAHAAHAGARHMHGEAAREQAQPPCHADGLASLRASCPCRCGDRVPGKSSSQRLGPAVLADEEAPAAPFGLRAAAEPEASVPLPPRQVPDPVPIAS
jgi:hypothetical protein